MFRILLSFRFISTFFLFTIFKICLGQAPSYLHYSVAEGLPSSEVYDVFQDKKGFMWFATDNGVVRYDGYQMEVFQSKEGLTDQVVFGFVEDAKGRVWFRTFSGRISYYFNKTISPYRYNDSLEVLCKNSLLYSLDIDSANNVWFSNGTMFGKIDSTGRVEKERVKPNNVAFKKTENTFMVAKGAGLPENAHTVFVHNRGLPFSPPRDRPPLLIHTLRWRGQEYFSYGTTIFRIDTSSVIPVFTTKDQIISLTLDSSEQLWIGYQLGGIECLRSFRDPIPNQFFFLDKKSISKILQDNRQGGYWISTLQDGIYYIPQLSLSIKSVPYNSKIRAVEVLNTEVVLGDEYGNLPVYDQKGNLVKTGLLNKLSILSILSTTKSNLWATDIKKVYILDYSLGIKKLVPNDLIINNQYEDHDGTIWGVSGPKVVQFSAHGVLLIERNLKKSYRKIFVDDNLYLFGRLGLDVFTRKFDPVQVPSIFKGLKISKILKLADTTLLIATTGNGFFVVNRLNWSFEHYHSMNRFTADNIYSATVADSTLWLGTENGIVATPIRSLLQKSPDYSFFNKKIGLPSNRIDHLIYCKPNVWAFYENGFCLVPAALSKKQDTPIFYLKNILINNQSASLDNFNQLAYDKNNIQIDFGFIDFKNQNIFIRSRLSQKARWSYSTERSIKYYSLSPDNYSFEMEYSLDHNRWTTVLSKDFIIKPQWWKDYRFQIALVIALFLFSSIYFKRILSRLKEKQNFLEVISANQQKLIEAELAAREGERSRIARDLHDSVGTSLAAAKMALYKLFKNSDPNVTIIEEQLQGTMLEIKNIVHELSPPGLERYGITKVINGYAQNIMARFDIKIEVHAFGSDVKDQKVNINIFRIIQELLSNSLKHGQAKNITIHINSFDESLNVLYQDDGIGFSKESIKSGSGLLNIESRVQTLKGNIQLESGQFGVSYSIDLPIVNFP
jgi:signal transduction histidine kinase